MEQTWIAYTDDHGESWVRQLESDEDRGPGEFYRGTQEACAAELERLKPEEVEEFYSTSDAHGRSF